MTLEVAIKDMQKLLWKNIKSKFDKEVRDDFGIYMISELMKGFDNTGVRGTHPEWKELSPYTIDLKVFAGYSRPFDPLIATGEMMQSFELKFGNNEMKIYNTKDYFKKHELGDPDNRLPKRDMMFFSEEDIKYLDKKVNDFLKKVA